MNIIRLPFRWERLQRSLRAEFDPVELSRLDNFVRGATDRGMRVILDPHNYARYYVQVEGQSERVAYLIGSEQVSYDDFADFWTRLANFYKDNPLVIFGLMNEPYGISAAQWLGAANAAIAAIRETGADNLILVPGTAYSGAHSWTAGYTGNSAVMGGVVDPGDNFAFDLHQYLDSDSSGTSETCVSTSIGSTRLMGATHWMRERGYRAFLGEFAVGPNETCLTALEDMLNYMDANDDVWLGWTWWAAGPWWSATYFFSIEPKPDIERPQLDVLYLYTPPPAPELSWNPARPGWEYTQSSGLTYELESSVNLIEWNTAIEARPGDGQSHFVEPNASDAEARFFRVKVDK